MAPKGIATAAKSCGTPACPLPLQAVLVADVAPKIQPKAEQESESDGALEPEGSTPLETEAEGLEAKEEVKEEEPSPPTPHLAIKREVDDDDEGEQGGGGNAGVFRGTIELDEGVDDAGVFPDTLDEDVNAHNVGLADDEIAKVAEVNVGLADDEIAKVAEVRWHRFCIC